MNTIYLATKDGLAICRGDGTNWQEVERVLKGQHVTSVMAREGVILAGTTEGVQRSDDGGKSWRAVSEGLSSTHVRWLAYHPAISDLEFAGTEPAGIFVSRDGAELWQARPEVAALRDEHEWMLPDIHDVAVHPSNPDLVFAVTGGGFYRSDDGGATWKLLYDCYCRAIWLDPHDAQHLIFGPAANVGRGGRIEESHDGGKTFQPASGSLKVPWANTMPERITQIGDELFTVLDDGRLLVAPLATLDWQFILEDVSNVNAVTAMHE